MLVLVDEPAGRLAGAPVDVMLTTSRPTWHGVADGHGRLEVRRIDVESSGRRIPQPRRATLWLPGPTGALAAAEQPDLVTLVARERAPWATMIAV